MSKKGLNESVDFLIGDLFKLYMDKVNSYGKKSIINFGWTLCLTKMDSKKERLIALASRKAEAIVGESIEDAVKDLLGYTLIWMRIIKGTYDLPIKKGQVDYTGTYQENLLWHLDKVGKAAKKIIRDPSFHNKEEFIQMDVISIMDEISGWYIEFKMENSKIDQENLYQKLEELGIHCFLYLLSIKGSNYAS